MTESDLEATMLRRAQRGLSPSPGDAARVRARLDAALLAPPQSPSQQPGASQSPGASRAPIDVVSLGKLGAALVLAAVTGAGGYVLGFRAGNVAASRSAEPRPAVTAPLVPAPTLAPAEAARPPLQPAPDLPGSKLSSRRTSGASTPLDVAPAPVASAPGESTLELETRLLSRVERALRDKNPRLALGLLGELDRQVPGGQLAEERQAGRVLAHCELGSDTAPELARAYAARYPSSAYLGRVRAACSASSAGKTIP